jgi:hypothetical protein
LTVFEQGLDSFYSKVVVGAFAVMHGGRMELGQKYKKLTIRSRL